MTRTHPSIRLFTVAVAAIVAGLLLLGMAGMARAQEFDPDALAELRAVLEPVLSEPSATRTSSDQTVYTAATGHAGKTCDVRVFETNEPQPSEHDGNRLVVTTDGRLIVALDIETGRGGASQTGNIPTLLGESITAEYDFGDDGVSSAGFNVIIDCKEVPPSTTTTLSPPSSTSTSVTSVSPSTTTTTEVPSTSTTSSTVPESSSTTTTVPTTTTSSSTTIPVSPTPPSSTVPVIPSGVPTGEGELPNTGLAVVTLGGVGLLLVALGAAAVYGTRRRHG